MVEVGDYVRLTRKGFLNPMGTVFVVTRMDKFRSRIWCRSYGGLEWFDIEDVELLTPFEVAVYKRLEQDKQ